MFEQTEQSEDPQILVVDSEMNLTQAPSSILSLRDHLAEAAGIANLEIEPNEQEARMRLEDIVEELAAALRSAIRSLSLYR